MIEPLNKTRIKHGSSRVSVQDRPKVIKRHEVLWEYGFFSDMTEAAKNHGMSVSKFIRDAVRHQLYRFGDKSNPNAIKSWDVSDFYDKVMNNRYPILLYGTAGYGKSTTMMRVVQSIMKARNFHRFSIILIDVKGTDYDFDTSKPEVREKLKADFPGTNRFHKFHDMSYKEVRQLERLETWPRFIRILLEGDRPENERGRDLADLINDLGGLKEHMKKQPWDVIFILEEALRISEYPEFGNSLYKKASIKGFASTLREYVHKAIFVSQEPFLKDIFHCIEVIPP